MNRPIPWVVWLAITQHLIWGLLLCFSSEPTGVTAIAFLANAFTDKGVAVLFLVVALMALWGCFRFQRSPRGIAWMLPQQLVLTFSAIGAIEATIQGRFADGVHHPKLFIFADQLPSILVLACHTAAIIELFGREGSWKDG